jgi:hypothetical protein
MEDLMKATENEELQLLQEIKLHDKGSQINFCCQVLTKLENENNFLDVTVFPHEAIFSIMWGSWAKKTHKQ